MNTRRTLAAAMCCVLWAVVPPAGAQDRPPDGLSASDWSSIRAVYEANRHAAFEVEGGAGVSPAWQARNPGQQWRTHFDGRGFLTTPDAGRDGESPRRPAWSWGLELVNYGVAPAISRCKGTPHISACGQRVEYEWDDTLTEWYVNDPRGLEHGYTVHRRPDSSALRAGQSGGPLPVAEATGNHRAPSGRKPDRDSGMEHYGSRPLQFTLAVRGDLRPRVSGDGRDVTFVDDAGAAVVNYNGLAVFDANGAAVPAWFECEGLDGRDARATHAVESAKYLRLVVDDSHAVYPLTIDPIAQQAYLKASNTGAFDELGLQNGAVNNMPHFLRGRI